MPRLVLLILLVNQRFIPAHHRSFEAVLDRVLHGGHCRLGRLLSRAHAVEECRWYNFDDHTPDKLSRSDSETEHVFSKGKFSCLNRLSSDLHHHDLNEEGKDEHKDKQEVVEEVRKHVHLVCFELSGVNLVK